MDNTLKEWAHRYIDVGWNIFPLLPKSKVPNHPLLKATGFTQNFNGVSRATWEPFQTLRVTHELVDVWWGKDPNANIALVCGDISGVTVIDIDTKADEPTWGDPQEIAFEICELTLKSITGSGGVHLFCNYAHELKNTKKRVHPQADIKNDGGYVVLPPSIHDKTGNTYTFDHFFQFSERGVQMLADFPEALKRRVIQKQDEKMSNDDWLYIMKGVKEGTDGRNNAGVQLLGKMLNAVYIEHNADDRFLPYLWDFMEWWNQKNQPPMSDFELKALFKSIVRRVL